MRAHTLAAKQKVQFNLPQVNKRFKDDDDEKSSEPD
jgi:hypothetical protein